MTWYSKTYWWLVLSLMFCLIPPTSWAARLQGSVIAVPTGEEIRIITAQGQQRRIRLLGIRTPSNDWRTVANARRHLASLLAGRQIVVDYHTLLKDGVILGRVWYGGADCALLMLKAGLAVVADTTALKPTVLRRYLAAELKARNRKMGYWQSK
jgi:endonuclease YncB( thermonuclease family)